MQAILRHINFDGKAQVTHMYTKNMFLFLSPTSFFDTFLLLHFYLWCESLDFVFSSSPSVSGEVHPGRQPRVCEGPVYHLPL